jgi:hypothetical protein
MSKDYFAELYVAGVLARSGWNVYFPHRDEGFDFIISKVVEGEILIRPVQVKGKYPETDKTDKLAYGYVGKLTQLHEEMVLAIPYFSVSSDDCPPAFIAYMPRSQLRKHARGYRCQPAEFKGGAPKRRRDYAKFFDDGGIQLLESQGWRNLGTADAPQEEYGQKRSNS